MAWDLVRNSAALGVSDGFSAHVELLRQFAFADMPRAAHAVLERMRRRGLRPSHDCFSLVIAAHARLWNRPAIVRVVREAQEHGAAMTPQLRWYGRLAAGLLAAGRHGEALAIVREFRRQNSLNAWARADGTGSERGVLGTESPMRKEESVSAVKAMYRDGETALRSGLGDQAGAAGGGLGDGSDRPAAPGSRLGLLPAPGQHEPLSPERAGADAERMRALGTVQLVRLSMCADVVGDVLNAVLLELRPRHAHADVASGVMADRDTVPVSELAELVADVPLARRLSHAERRHAERLAVSNLLADVTRAAEGVAAGTVDEQDAPFETEVLALAQHITIGEDGSLAAIFLSSPVLVTALWRAAGLGDDGPPGSDPALARGVRALDPSDLVRDVRVARRVQAQRLVETMLYTASRGASDAWRGTVPDVLWPAARHGSAHLFDALDSAGVVPALGPLLSVMTMAREDGERRGGDGTWVGLRAALMAERHGLTVTRVAEALAMAEDVASLGMSEAGLTPRHAPTVGGRRVGLADGLTHRPTVARGLDGREVVWFPAVIEALEAAERRSKGGRGPGGGKGGGGGAAAAEAEEAEEDGDLLPGQRALRRSDDAEAAAREARAAAAAEGGAEAVGELEAAEAARSAAPFDHGVSLARRLLASMLDRGDAEAATAQVMLRATRKRAASAALSAAEERARQDEESRRAAPRSPFLRGRPAPGAGSHGGGPPPAPPGAGAPPDADVRAFLEGRLREHDAALSRLAEPPSTSGRSLAGVSDADALLLRETLSAPGGPADTGGGGRGGRHGRSPSVAEAAARVTALQLAAAPLAAWWADVGRHLAPLLPLPGDEGPTSAPGRAAWAAQWERSGGVPLSTLAAPESALPAATVAALRAGSLLPSGGGGREAMALLAAGDAGLDDDEVRRSAVEVAEGRGRAFAEWCSSQAAVREVAEVMRRVRHDGAVDLTGLELVLDDEEAIAGLRDPENWRGEGSVSVLPREAGQPAASSGARPYSPQRTSAWWLRNVLRGERS